tara:strand:+ start:110 stop:493 length:384 start_codon:yes stop_codon:yes gene_type:complete
MGAVKKIGEAIVADNLDKIIQDVADAKQDLEKAKEAFAMAEAEFLATGIGEATLSDGRKVTVVHSTVRNIDPDIVKDNVGRGVWQRITNAVVNTKAFDLEVEGGRIDQEVVDLAVTVKDRKPSVRVK